MIRDLPDKRALSMPDIPHSARCRTCWENAYALWIGEPHDGRCPFGAAKASECEFAIAANEDRAASARQHGGRDVSKEVISMYGLTAENAVTMAEFAVYIMEKPNPHGVWTVLRKIDGKYYTFEARKTKAGYSVFAS